MGDDELKKKPPFYGSAGMAAAGMIPIVRAQKPTSDEDSTSEEEANESEEQTKSVVAETGEAVEAQAEMPPPETSSVEESAEPISAVESVEPTPEAPTSADLPVEEASFLSAAILGQASSPDAVGNFDHAFERINGLRLVSVSDGNAANLEETRARTGARSGYANYLEMLAKESPQLVAVSAADTKLHFPMVKAALQSGAHVCCDSPFAVTLKEADELIALAGEKERHLVVANSLLCDPALKSFEESREELIGDLIEIRLFGRSDDTAGGEDLLRSGIPLFDLANRFVGESNFCTASVEIEGAPAIAEDAEDSPSLGLLLGDSIRAEFSTGSGIIASFVSDRRLRHVNGPMGAEFIGSKGRARLFAEDSIVISVLKEPDLFNPSRSDSWEIFAGSDSAELAAGSAYREVILDLVSALENDESPACAASRSIRALEMAHSVWQAGASMKRAYLPLTNRIHPLSEDSL